MIFLELTRMETGPDGTIGALTINKRAYGFILEPRWKDNERNISCIPTGQYICKRYDSKSYNRPCLKILSVHGRSDISMHPGNTIRDSKGCLLPGKETGYLEDRRAVLRSRIAMDEIMSEIRDICHLTIREAF